MLGHILMLKVEHSAVSSTEHQCQFWNTALWCLYALLLP